MTSKKMLRSLIALCITATLAVAVCGCDDLGAYTSEEEYYSSFGDVVLIDGSSREETSYSVESYFYNKESRESFLQGEDNAYRGIKHNDYVYMAVPLKSDIEMDTLALYLQSKKDVAVFMNVYITESIPTAWKGLEDVGADSSETEPGAEEKVYDDPDPATRVGELAVHLRAEEWNSFLLDSFTVGDTSQTSIPIKEGQYLLIQIRNNSGVRILDEKTQLYVDPQTGMQLEKAEITMTNLMIRALNVNTEAKVQGGEE